jgi:hypothetical protein
MTSVVWKRQALAKELLTSKVLGSREWISNEPLNCFKLMSWEKSKRYILNNYNSYLSQRQANLSTWPMSISPYKCSQQRRGALPGSDSCCHSAWCSPAWLPDLWSECRGQHPPPTGSQMAYGPYGNGCFSHCRRLWRPEELTKKRSAQ